MAWFAAGGSVLGIDKVAGNVLDCLSGKPMDDGKPRYAFMHRIAVVAGIGTGVFTTIYALASQGPTIMGLLSGPIVALLVFGLITVTTCLVEGNNLGQCVVGEGFSMIGGLIGQLTGLPISRIRKTTDNLSKSALKAVGCR